jgi:GNAT superfamily N-acetyltransferase
VSERERDETLTVDGRDIVSYVRIDGEPPWADRAVLLVPVEEATPAILAAMPGWHFVPDTDADPIAGAALAAALQAAGAVVARHAFGYSYPLDAAVDPGWATPQLPEGASVAELSGVSQGLVTLSRRAFGPGHPDHEHVDVDTAVELGKLFDGTYGELMAGTAQVVRAGVVIAALVVNRFRGEPPYGGPWIVDVFRDPDDPAARGLGSVLIRRALARLAADGEPALTLAVTAGNPAAQRYEALGFTRCWAALRLRLPGERVSSPLCP